MNLFSIQHIEAGEILDSRGNPTVLATVELAGGSKAASAAPSGASKGKLEAMELRDNNPGRYNGMGVLKACSNVNVRIADVLAGMDAQDQEAIDRSMIQLDGSRHKSRIGANAILSVSQAVAKAVAMQRKLPLFQSLQETFSLPKSTELPIPIMNLVNGGKHASTNVVIQEFQITFRPGRSAEQHIRAGSEVFHALAQVLSKARLDTDVGNEGGYSPDFASIDDVFTFIVQAIEQAGYEPGKDIMLGIDAAADSFYHKGRNQYWLAPPERKLSPIELADTYLRWAETYPIVSIEDPFHEEAWDDWSAFVSRFSGKSRMVIGDDLLVTDQTRIAQAADEDAVSAVLIKPNQIGTITETVEAVRLAQSRDLKVIVSHRSGETDDTFITDFAVAVGAQYLKAGAPSRGERVAKYNRLLRISKEQ